MAWPSLSLPRRPRPVTLGYGLFGKIGVYRGGADTRQHGEMMHVQTLACRHVHRGEGAKLLAHEMRMHRAGGKNHGKRHPRFRDGLVGEHHVLAPGAHRLFGLARDAVKRGDEPVPVSILDIEGAVDEMGLPAKPGHKRAPLRHGKHRRVQKKVVALLRRLVQDVAKIAKPSAKRHHMALAKAVDRRVRDLRETLPEEMVKPAIAVREHGDGRVVAHRADRLLGALGHRLEDEFKVLHGPAGHHLPAAHLGAGPGIFSAWRRGRPEAGTSALRAPPICPSCAGRQARQAVPRS